MCLQVILTADLDLRATNKAASFNNGCNCFVLLWVHTYYVVVASILVSL